MTRRSPIFLGSVFFGLLFIAASTVRNLGQDVPCQMPDRLPQTGGATWPRGANITVVIDPNDFPTEGQQQAIEQAFIAWRDANTNSNVKFYFTIGSNPQGATNTYYVHRGATVTGGGTSIAYTGSPSTQGNVTTSAITTVDSTITREATLTISFFMR